MQKERVLPKTPTDPRPAVTFLLLLVACFSLALVIRVPEISPVLDLPGERSPFLPLPEAPDFAAITDIDQRKDVFFDYMAPFVEYQNQQILSIRTQLDLLLNKVLAGETLSRHEISFITAQSRRYRVQPQRSFSANHLRTLLRRIDIIPSSLVLAQAANESAWGTSRFAVEGNNYFGQWCYTPGCGLVPEQRGSDQTHEVQAFNSAADSVAAYFMNLNTFPSYQYLREMRQDMRQKGEPIDGKRLAEGLIKYSARGEAYIKELQSMIDYNGLEERDHSSS